jgi:hypothetical protein
MRTGLTRGYPHPTKQSGVVMDVLAAASISFVTGGYDVFLTEIVGPWFIDRFQGGIPIIPAAPPRDTPTRCLVYLDGAVLRTPQEPGHEPLRDAGAIRQLCEECEIDRSRSRRLQAGGDSC